MSHGPVASRCPAAAGATTHWISFCLLPAQLALRGRAQPAGGLPRQRFRRGQASAADGLRSQPGIQVLPCKAFGRSAESAGLPPRCPRQTHGSDGATPTAATPLEAAMARLDGNRSGNNGKGFRTRQRSGSDPNQQHQSSPILGDAVANDSATAQRSLRSPGCRGADPTEPRPTAARAAGRRRLEDSPFRDRCRAPASQPEPPR